MSDSFWQAFDVLIAHSKLVIDRPRGSAHPRYPDQMYALDYGYLAGTSAIDKEGIDVWVGSLPEKTLDAIILTVDLMKRDSEPKLLLGCTEAEKQHILTLHNNGNQSALLIERFRLE